MPEISAMIIELVNLDRRGWASRTAGGRDQVPAVKKRGQRLGTVVSELD